MIMSDSKPEFIKAFVAAQKSMDAVKKANTNPAFRSKYADLSAVVEAVVPALNAAGIGVVQFPKFDGEFVSVDTVFFHESGAELSGTLQMRPTKSDPQGIGSAITYCRRYALLAMTGAAPEDDDGNSASRPAEPSEAPKSNRLSSAEAKRQKLHEPFLAEIDKADLAELVEIEAAFEERTHIHPLSWLDQYRDRMVSRRKELFAQAELDDMDSQAGDAAARDFRAPGAGDLA